MTGRVYKWDERTTRGRSPRTNKTGTSVGTECSQPICHHLCVRGATASVAKGIVEEYRGTQGVRAKGRGLAASVLPYALIHRSASKECSRKSATASDYQVAAKITHLGDVLSLTRGVRYLS